MRKALLRRRQHGAVAILMGLSIVILFGFIGLVLDLGRTYTFKTELQNAADAGALAGARELNQTTAGIDLAFAKAKEYAGKNRFNFASSDVVVPDANIQFGPSPDGPWSSKAEAEAAPSGKTFVKVDTGLRTLNTVFMRIANAGSTTTGTFGSAVAGRFIVQITPLGVCAIDPNTKGGVRPATGELTEYGFRRGVSYNVPSLNPLGSPRDPIWINPVAYQGGPIACQGNQGSSNFMAPFVCQGGSGSIPVGGRVYVNTGKQVEMERALNSRFELPLAGVNPSPCAAGTAPPDTNIQYYSAGLPPSGNPKPADPSGDGYPREWMEPGGNVYPSTQTIQLKAGTVLPVDYPNLNPPAQQYGALWSFTRAVRAVGAAPDAKAGALFDLTNANWAALYNNGAATFPSGNQLLDVTGYGAAAPYEQTSGNYFRAPATAGVKYRRVLNLAILDCTGYVGGGICASSLPVVGIGRFFMQVPANLNPGGGLDPHIETEFAGLLEPAPKNDVRLYR